ncbi:MAG: hypothetical protein A3J81_06300 [Nitrospirae bacterium RIFOXYB2_FULL_43_5]|nr:MAG: hypothetical protein A2X54_07350 [Nitrospirae bacterium GWF2_44_13]OGW33932.1 MAG: hypothetical protein A2088_02205 [Nitrospirae bacterium GWD2_44_7]OGW64150.1 MAG: hypothetical protein A2222_09475 [Nitrospirae bacterium RIFOXYA2_FULL_44_9]OGW73660.1 MAG: hypothetical protein A3J81_06300 [Nitrospirae bacterium RIFOXYB2_FULL_43_5]HBG92431.1 hypothetical protein [Nitrospiraceae bacterium]
MKKYLALVLGVIFTLGFAVSAFAIHAEIPAETQAAVAKGSTQITIGGNLRFRGEFKHSLDLNQSTILENADDNDARYDGRVRIRIQADVSKNTQGVIHLESGSVTENKYYWGTSGTAGGVYRSIGNGKKGTLDILEAWIQHKFNIGVPAGIKIGHMPVKLGNGIFFNHTKFGDDVIVFFIDPTKELHIGLLNLKLIENTSNITDDSDAYIALLAYKGKGFNLSADYTRIEDQRGRITTDGVYTASALAASDNGTTLNNVGLRADATFGNLNIEADVELQSGKTDYAGSASDIKHKGRAYALNAKYKIAPATLSLGYGSGSGDNDSADLDNDVFVTAVQNTQLMTFVYDYRVVGATGLTNTGIANTTYFKAGVAANLTKDLSANVNYYVLRATKANSGTAINGLTTHTSKKIGSELDAKITYKLDKNLVYYVEGGYLWTGTFYDSATVVADDAYAVRHGLELSF